MNNGNNRFPQEMKAIKNLFAYKKSAIFEFFSEA